MKVIPTISSDLPAWIQRDLERFNDARRGPVERFIRELKIQGASRKTIENSVKAIRTLGFDGKPYKRLTSKDLMAWMEYIDGNGWSVGTVNLFRVGAKHFLRWIHGCRSSRDPTPEFLKCVRMKRQRRELPKTILTKEEVKKLIDTCDSQRDRTLVFVAYESGARSSEVLGLKIADVEFDRFGAVLRLSGKTGERCTRLIESVPDLRIWMSMHPGKDDPDAPLWPTRRTDKTPLGPNGFRTLLEKNSRKVGITKHVHPHLLRHTRATHLASVLNEAQMRTLLGWTRNSRMPEIYVHLSGRDVDSALLKHYGIKVEKSEESVLGPKACPWCKMQNSPSAKFCQQCNAPLDPVGATEAVEKQKKREEMVARFIQWLQQKRPEVADDFFKEAKEEIEELA